MIVCNHWSPPSEGAKPVTHWSSLHGCVYCLLDRMASTTAELSAKLSAARADAGNLRSLASVCLYGPGDEDEEVLKQKLRALHAAVAAGEPR